MKKFKTITTCIIAAAILLTATGCNNNNATENTTTTTAAADTSAADTTAAEETSAEVTESTEAVEEEEMEYVIENGITDTMIALSRLNEGNKVRLANVMKKAAAGEEITIGYFGGSITQGSSADANTCYARLTTNWFEENFPEAKINYINAGIGATGSYIGVHRVQKDLLDANPDLVFIDFSVNDTTENTERNINSYDSLIRKIYSAESNPAIVTIAMTMEDGTSFQDYHADIVKAYDIPMISYKNAILHVIDKGYIKWTDISDDNIHPNFTGHGVLTEIITAYLDDVKADLDNISGDESDISTPFTTDKYADANVLCPANTEPSSLGAFTVKSENFGNFGDHWEVVSDASGNFEDGSSLVFETNCKNIGIFYGKLTGRAANFEIYIDGEYLKTVNTDFTGGWGNYVEAEEMIALDEAGTHTIEIKPIGSGTENRVMVKISAIAIS